MPGLLGILGSREKKTGAVPQDGTIVRAPTSTTSGTRRYRFERRGNSGCWVDEDGDESSSDPVETPKGRYLTAIANDENPPLRGGLGHVPIGE